jgi:hypothetical protein
MDRMPVTTVFFSAAAKHCKVTYPGVWLESRDFGRLSGADGIERGILIFSGFVRSALENRTISTYPSVYFGQAWKLSI